MEGNRDEALGKTTVEGREIYFRLRITRCHRCKGKQRKRCNELHGRSEISQFSNQVGGFLPLLSQRVNNRSIGLI